MAPDFYKDKDGNTQPACQVTPGRCLCIVLTVFDLQVQEVHGEQKGDSISSQQRLVPDQDPIDQPEEDTGNEHQVGRQRKVLRMP